jgi:hypothetical protein
MREDRQNWPSVGVLALALLISAPNARRSCGVVSFPSAEFCINGHFRVKMNIDGRAHLEETSYVEWYNLLYEG